MNYFGMTYKEVLNSPFQRLIMLANSIPKYKSKEKEHEGENKHSSLLAFASANGIATKK